MKKWLLGMLLGGVLGIPDGLSAMVSTPSDPEVQAEIATIVIGSTVKGLVAGVLIGFFAQKVRSLPLGILFGLGVGALLALPIAYAKYQQGKFYFVEIML